MQNADKIKTHKTQSALNLINALLRADFGTPANIKCEGVTTKDY